MKLSAAGLALIEEFEGLRLESYQDGAGIWTIGYGTTRRDGRPVEEGEACTQQQAEEWLSNDVAESEGSVNTSLSQFQCFTEPVRCPCQLHIHFGSWISRRVYTLEESQ